MSDRRKQRVFAISTIVGIALMTACNNPPPSDQHLQEQAAQATENAKQASKEALAQARVAAANAEQTVNDVAAGVKQGMDSKTAADNARIDLNSASEADLTSLPGISVVKARQIIQNRPYTSTHDLVKSGVLTEHQFDEIAPKVTVH
jgi:DNA uptake protein ComE-like DNA-binding protein